MEQIFVTLQGIIVRALPTFVLVILLHWYLKKVLFQPLERVLDERRARTEGAVAAGESSLAAVRQKLADYENQLNQARGVVFREQEASRKRMAEQQAQAVEAAKASAAERVAAIRASLAAEVAQAKSELGVEADRLAGEIAGVVLSGRVQ